MRAATNFGEFLKQVQLHFNPRCPCGQRPWYLLYYRSEVYISIHAAHAGSDLWRLLPLPALHNFNPRCPCGQRHYFSYFVLSFLQFQSTLPMRAATNNKSIKAVVYGISIHAAHAGSDPTPIDNLIKIVISIHAAHAGSDYFLTETGKVVENFNPRCPCGQRHGSKNIVPWLGYFNPRCPCGQRPTFSVQWGNLPDISIHAAHAGSDL